MASERLKWIRGEQERRRTERGRQRSEMMEQRKQGAQTQYLQRQANKAGWKEDLLDNNTTEGRRAAVRQMPEQAINAIAMGETQRQYVTAQDQLKTAETAREAALITAKSPEAVQGIKTEGDKYVVNAEQYGLNARQKRELDLQREQYVAPKVYKDKVTGKIVTVGGAQIYDEPQATPTGGFESIDDEPVGWRNPDGTMNWMPQEEAPGPVRVGGSLVDPTTGDEVFREPTEMEEFDEFARTKFQGSAKFRELKESGASNDEIEAAFMAWEKTEYSDD